MSGLEVIEAGLEVPRAVPSGGLKSPPGPIPQIINVLELQA
jgi:hypothetical protein